MCTESEKGGDPPNPGAVTQCSDIWTICYFVYLLLVLLGCYVFPRNISKLHSDSSHLHEKQTE